MILQKHVVDNILNETGYKFSSIAIKHEIFNSTLLIYLPTVKWFQVLLCITPNSIKY